ncbi:MAG: hypothetical protein ACYC7J_20705 [Syntrophales bacterium]
MFGDIIPKNLSGWIFLLAACLIGLVIGNWIRQRRNKAAAQQQAYVRMATPPQKKRVSKKERVKARRQPK